MDKDVIASAPQEPPSQRSENFRSLHYPTATDAQWRDWHWQIKNSITTLAELERIFGPVTTDESEACSDLPMRITPYYASLLGGHGNPIRRCMVPTIAEQIYAEGESEDPLCEDDDSPVEGLTHRYPDRVLLRATGFCAAYCRYCTRSRAVGNVGTLDTEAAITYIQCHKEVRDVLISGGDPLTLPDSVLDELLCRLRAIPHVEIIRIGTKTPVVLPQRITPELCAILKAHHPLFVNIHFTHPRELTRECIDACSALADAGIPLGSQTVLLKGVNDDATVMKALFQGLLKARVRPVYLYAEDMTVGTSHFRTSVAAGIGIIENLRGHTTGMAVPQFVIDAPGGGGKIPLQPQYVVAVEGRRVILRNYENKTFEYLNPF